MPVNAIGDGAEPPTLSEDDYNKLLGKYLAKLACEDQWTAHGIAGRACGYEYVDVARATAIAEALLKARAKDGACEPLKQLPQEWVDQLERIVREAEENDANTPTEAGPE